MILFSGFVEIYKHSFTIRDAAANWQDWENDWLDSGIGVFPGGISVFAKASSGLAPLLIEKFDQRPENNEAFHTSIKIGGLTSTGPLAIESAVTEDNETTTQTLDIEAGMWGVLVHSGNEDCVYADDNCRGDFYRLALYPVDELPTCEKLFSNDLSEDPRTEPRLAKEDLVIRQTISDDWSERLYLLAELARHDSPMVGIAIKDGLSAEGHVAMQLIDDATLLASVLEDLSDKERVISTLMSVLRDMANRLADSFGNDQPRYDLQVFQLLLVRADKLLPKTRAYKQRMSECAKLLREFVENARYQGLDYEGVDGYFFFDPRPNRQQT